MVSCECVEDRLVGRRVAAGKHRGTVRYQGQLSEEKGEWLGVEWDDHTRGKHDGSHKAVRYFSTKHPTAGSFVRLQKVDFGRSCVVAIKERYADNQLAVNTEELQEIQKAMNAPSLELVGFEKVNKQQSFCKLQVLGLHELQISCAGEGLAEMCPNVREVDLSANLLSTWRDVANITECFPHLELLNLSDNRLEIPEEPGQLESAFKNLKHLVMAHMDYSWDEICECSKMWPQIEILQVPYNNIRSLYIPENSLRNLTFLDLEGNSIPHWEEINKLGSLERLDTLNVSDLGLTNICFPSPQTLFKNLQCLLISDNKLDKWNYISELNKLPRLEELRFSHNPVLEGESAVNGFYKTIARIGSLKVFNRNKILREDRRGAELEYLKEFGRAWLESAKSPEARSSFVLAHPRFPLLCKEHGGVEEGEVEEKSTCLSSRLVRLKLTSADKSIEKTLPRTMLVTSLVPMCQRLFRTGNAQLTLSFRSNKNPNVEGVLDNLLKSLDFYSIEDGDEIFVKL